VKEGLFFGLLSGAFWATSSALTKKALKEGYEENFVLWVRFPLATLFLLPLGLLYWEMNLSFLLTTFLWLPAEVVASLLFVKSLKFAPLSVAMPLLNFMPLFSALWGWFLLGERPTPVGWLGILLVVSGSFVLSGGNPAFLLRKRGALYALLSSFLFGLNVVIGKVAVQVSNQFFFSWYYSLVMTLGVLPFVRRFPPTKSLKRPLFPAVGLFFSGGLLFYAWGYLYAYASYVASAERLGVLFDLLYGKLFFGEEVRRAFWGSLLMVAGAILLSL